MALSLDEQIAAALALLGSALLREKLTLASAESCTGGLFAAHVTSVSGSSAYFRGSVVAYDNAVKTSHLSVSPELLKAHGAVSAPVADAMARGGRTALGSDICISVTGIAGPGGGTLEKPLGTVWSALAYRDRVSSQLWQLTGDRTSIREQSCLAMMQWITATLG